MESKKICVICGKEFYGWGNNPYPVKEEGSCCDECNMEFVVPTRIMNFNKECSNGRK